MAQCENENATFKNLYFVFSVCKQSCVESICSVDGLAHKGRSVCLILVYIGSIKASEANGLFKMKRV